jgi:hypothetical protein
MLCVLVTVNIYIFASPKTGTVLVNMFCILVSSNFVYFLLFLKLALCY